jgi:hypothetical protein
MGLSFSEIFLRVIRKGTTSVVPKMQLTVVGLSP